jgi:signal transduction histidine kinase
MNHQAASLANPSHVPGAPYHRMHQAEAETKPDLQSSWPAKRSSKQPLAEVFPWLESPLAAGRSGPEGIEPSNLAVTLQGARRCFEINCSMMLDVSEKFLAHIVTLRDITERRRQEEMLSKRALEIERLRQWESLGMLASGIAHDFNNLLAAIDGRCRMIRKRVPAEDEIMRSSVRYILEAVDKGVELTKTMRACSGREVGWAAHQDLSALVRLWAEDLTEPIPSHVHVSIHADTPLPGVPLHRGHIYVVLSNLLANALEALVDNKPGTIVIKTGITSREPQPGFQSIFFRETSALQFVYVEVEDNGAGIDESILPKILDPFFSTKFIGRGLGLAAVRGVVAGHRGALNIRTVLGQGTAIQVLFPIETPGDA